VRQILIGFLVLWSFFCSPGQAQRVDAGVGLGEKELAALDQLPLDPKVRERYKTDLAILFDSYPGSCLKLEVKKEGKISVVMKNGAAIPYDDGRPKGGLEAMLTSPDLEDMLSQVYPTGRPREAPRGDFDPGRVRVGAFFDAVYGASPGEVKANLRPVNFAGRQVSFNAQNGAAQALAQVGEKLGELLKNRRDLEAYVFPVSGTFAPRTIAGTDRKSPHSWGIAIDLNAKRGAYWQWGKGKLGSNLLALQQAYPYDLVRLFEESGFIWGGRWHHYDTMHFEYRPELLKKAALVKGGSVPLQGAGR
jgi:hypothetical protein